MDEVEATTTVARLVKDFPFGSDNSEFYTRKQAFMIAIGEDASWAYTCSEHARNAIVAGRKTPDEVVAIAMLIFQP